MSELDDALYRAGQYNNGAYDPVTNPYGHTGRGGTLANWVRSLKDGVAIFNAMRAIFNAINFVAERAAVQTIYQQCQDLVRQITVGSTSALAFPAVDKVLLAAGDIVDVFVYDTRLDDRLPDGSRWNEPGRCAGLSWYEEGPSATRGVKRDFPLVALIVARQTTLTIYDGLDIDPVTGGYRMWMVFNLTGGADPGGLLYGGGVSLSGLWATNGRLYLSLSGGSVPFREIRFATDEAFERQTFNLSRFRGGLAQRNTDGTGYTVVSAAGAVLANVANAVHAHVYPGAPLDAAGLPIPTITVAMGGGVSVIHPWGRVVSITGGTSSPGVRSARLLADGYLVSGDWSGVYGMAVGPVPYADVFVGAWASTFALAIGDAGQPLAAIPAGDVVAQVGSSGVGLCLFPDRSAAAQYEKLGSFLTASYNTGWLPGHDFTTGSKAVLATLCDATTGPLTGGSILTLDGSTAAGWGSAYGASMTASGGELVLTTSDPSGYIAYPFATVAGQTYLLRGVARNGTAGFVTVSAQSQIGSPLSRVPTVWATSDTDITLQFTAVGATTYIVAQTGGSAGTAYFDNLRIDIATPDRSYQQRGLITVGTLQRDAVALGAEMAAWSGYSATSYQWQPYNPALDFGAGDLCVAFWSRNTANGGQFFQRTGGAGAAIAAAVSSGKLVFSITDGTSGVGATSQSDCWSANDAFALWVLVRRGGALEIWRNGVLEATVDASGVGSLDNASAALYVGINDVLNYPLSGGHLSMFRTSGTAPTPAQIRRMYDDERHLFAAGGKCLIPGVPVEADHDPLTGRLAVAANSGTSIVKGLQRIAFSPVTSVTTANHKAVAMRGQTMLVGTAAEAAARTEAIGGKEEILVPEVRRPAAPFAARGETTDATPLDLAPRIHVGERELVEVEARILGRVQGASDGQRISYVRKATFYRDAGGNVTLQGGVQTIGTDTEVTSTADATLNVDATAQTVSARVTGVAGTRIAWTAALTITRYSEETRYAVQ